MRLKNKKLRKLVKGYDIKSRKSSKYFTNVDSIVINGLPLIIWHRKFGNKEIGVEEYYTYFYAAMDKVDKFEKW